MRLDGKEVSGSVERREKRRGSYVNSPAKGIRTRIVIVKDDQQADSQAIHKTTDLT